MGFYQSIKEYEKHENMVLNAICEGICFTDDKDRIRKVRDIERRKRRDGIYGIEVDENKNCIIYYYKNNFKLN